MSAKTAGELLLRFQAFVTAILNARLVHSKDNPVKSAKIAAQLADFNQSMIDYRKSLLSVEFHGLKSSKEEDADAEMVHFVKIAMGMQPNPIVLRQHAQLGFPAASGGGLARSAQTAGLAPGTTNIAKYPLMNTGLVNTAGGQQVKANTVRVVGQCYPVSFAILGTAMGKPTNKGHVGGCFSCNSHDHRAFECPTAFFKLYSTAMPGHDKDGIITSPQTYWRAGKPVGEEISANIAKEWLAHTWTSKFDALGVIALGISTGTLEECGSRP
jgi:hypothetical protein